MALALHHKAFAALYDPLQRAAERSWLGRAREELLGEIEGEVLEIGAGTGASLPHYRRAGRVVAAEPDREMRRRLAEKAERAAVPVEVVDWPAERLEAPDGTFDVVVSTLVLCTAPEPRRALAEVRRVLRPGGQLWFIEHVAGDDPRRLAWKRRLEPMWSWFALGCRLTQDTVSMMETEGFTVDVTDVLEPNHVPPIVKPFVVGTAAP